MSEVLTVPEVAERLRLGRRTIERLIASGELRSAKVGTRRLVRLEEIERYLRDAERRGRVA